jgi:EAL domain-containing protein (putative c-di-GMP-specific phosphodiesterase class I)
MINTLGASDLARQDRPMDPRVAAALAPGGLRLAAQQIVDLDGRRVGWELLSRPRDGTRPDHLFEAARATGGEPELSGRVIELTTAAAGTLGDLPVSLNLDPTLLGPLSAPIRRLARLLPGGLRLEIPETLPLDNPLLVARTARGLGVGLVADDLGAGLPRRSAELARLQLAAIKLDRGALREAGSGRAQTAVFAAYLELALRLAPVVVVEGVEEKRELRLLRTVAAGRREVYAQGYLFGPPQPLAPTIHGVPDPLPATPPPRRQP